MSVTSVEMDRGDSLTYRVTLKGSDTFGSWVGNGDFMMTNDGPFFWMRKAYDNADSAGQTGDWVNLIYESKTISYEEVAGRWFYEHMEWSFRYSGKWKIVHGQPGLIESK
jgi:hypothetical protein